MDGSVMYGSEQQQHGYKLSAEAQEFVPLSHDPANLPKYMFNCYPFVTENASASQHSNIQSSPQFASQSKHAHHGTYGQSRKSAHPLTYPPPRGYNTGTFSHRPPAPACMYRQGAYTSPSQVHGGRTFYSNPRCNNHSNDRSPAYSPVSPPHIPSPQYNHGYPPQMSPGTSTRPPHPPHPNTQHPQATLTTTHNKDNWQNGTTSSAAAASSVPAHRKHLQKQSSNGEKRSKISVGTQNQHGSKSEQRGTHKSAGVSRSAVRTIILVDTAAQTDFASEIADHTLEQMPNALYQGKRKVKRKTLPSRSAAAQNTVNHDSSTDSEELDHSDSGYSSPLHRQNQISSGTDARTKTSSESSNLQRPISSVGRVGHVSASSLTQVTHSIMSTHPVVTVSQAQSMSTVCHTAAIYSQHQHISHIPHHNSTAGNVCMSYASALSTPSTTAALHNITSLSGNLPISAEQSAQLDEGANSEEEIEGEGEEGALTSRKKKRKRGRRRRKRDKGGIEAAEIKESSQKSYMMGAGHEGYQSPILSQEAPFNLLAPEMISENFPTFSEAGLYDDSSECKLSGKRKKRREQANKAAMEEQLEIDLEQQALKVVNQTPIIVKPTPIPIQIVTALPPPQQQTGGKKSQAPVSVNIMDFIKPKAASNSIATSDADSSTLLSKRGTMVTPRSTVLNPLDSSSPLVKRGKERETPKAKKPSALKKVILKEREERKRLRYIGEGPVDLISTPDSSLHFTSEPEDNDDDDVISDIEDPNSLNNSLADDLGTPQSQDLSPVSQNSPISVGLLSPPTSLSNCASGVGSPTMVGDIIQKIHSRRFREYCKQVLDKEIDANCTNLLQTLVKFQDRLYHKDPIKAKTKRRLVLGLREVTKHLKLCRVKLVIISPNLEKIQSKGGLDDALNMIINLCSEQDVPFVFALGRRSLGRACAKLVPVSVVGIFNYQGAEVMYNDLISLTSKAREAYHEMVDALAKEIAEYGGALKGSCGLYFSHLGHSRTPSGCSAISFTSSILSEPLPEVVKQDHTSSNNNNNSTNGQCTGNTTSNYNKQISITSSNASPSFEQSSVSSALSHSAGSSVSDNRGPLQDDIYDIDEGNEADTEDNETMNHIRAINQNTASISSLSPPAGHTQEVCVPNKRGEEITPTVHSSSSNTAQNEHKTCVNNNNTVKNSDVIPTYQERLNSVDAVSQSLSQLSLKKRTPSHRRSSSMGSHMDVRSQTSSRTLDQHDTVSTHSSVTIENASESEHITDPLGSSSSSCRLDRIKSWVQDVDTTNTPPNTDISRDDEEFAATYTACEANTDALISRSRSPSITKTST